MRTPALWILYRSATYSLRVAAETIAACQKNMPTAFDRGQLAEAVEYLDHVRRARLEAARELRDLWVAFAALAIAVVEIVGGLHGFWVWTTSVFP